MDDMTFELRKNKWKTEDKHPEWKGEGKLFGHVYGIAAWVRESSRGSKYMSCSIELKDKTGDKDKDRLNASLFRNDHQSEDEPWDYQGKIRGREDIILHATNVKEDDVNVVKGVFLGQRPLLDEVKETFAAEEVEDEEIPF